MSTPLDNTPKKPIHIDPATLQSLKQVGGMNPSAASDKVKVGDSFSESYNVSRFNPTAAHAIKEIALPSVHPMFWDGLNDPIEGQRHVIARVFPFTVKLNDGSEIPLIEQLNTIPNNGAYLKNAAGQVVTRNNDNITRGIDLTKPEVREIVRNFLVGAAGKSSKYAGLHLAGFDAYESMLSPVAEPDAARRKKIVEDGRTFMKEICAELNVQNKKSMVGDLTAHDGGLTGKETLDYVVENVATKNIIIRDQYNAYHLYNHISEYTANLIKTSRQKAPDTNFMLVSHSIPVPNGALSSYEFAGRDLKAQLVDKLGTDLNTGTGNIGVYMSASSGLINPIDPDLNVLAASQLRPFSIRLGQWTRYDGEKTPAVLADLKQFNMSASKGNDDTTSGTSLAEYNPFLLDETTPAGAAKIALIGGKVIKTITGEPYKYQGKYLLPDFREASVSTALLGNLQQNGSNPGQNDASHYGVFVMGQSEYEKAIDQAVAGGAVTITPANGPVTINPVTTITPNGPLVNDRTAILQSARQFSDDLNVAVTSDTYGLNKFLYRDDLSYSSPLVPQSLLARHAGRHMVLNLDYNMTNADIRAKFAAYAQVGQIFPLNVNMTNVPAINQSTVNAVKARLESIVVEFNLKEIELNLATGVGYSNPQDLAANLQFKTPNQPSLRSSTPEEVFTPQLQKTTKPTQGRVD